MTNIKSALVDRLGQRELESFSEFVKVFPLDGHEPENLPVLISGHRLDNDGWSDNWKVKIGEHNFNLATLLAFAKYGFEKAVELKQ